MIVRPSEYFERKLQTTLPHDVKEIINREANTVSFPAGHTVLWEGDTASYLYYIIQGVVRGYYIDSKGNDVTKCFCAEDDFFSTEGFRISSPATFTIECLEECKCLQLPYTSLKSIMNSNKSIALKDIASYIGVRAASLSRIRKKQKSDEN